MILSTNLQTKISPTLLITRLLSGDLIFEEEVVDDFQC